MWRMKPGLTEGGQSEPSFSFLVTLLTMLDFETPGKVSQEDWDRGMNHLHAPGVGHQVSWSSLQKRFDKQSTGEIDFGEILGLAPLDPRLEQLLRVLMQTLVRLSEKVDLTMGQVNKNKLKSMREGINRWRSELLGRVFRAWRQLHADESVRRGQIVASMKLAPCRKCFNAVRDLIAQRHAKTRRAAQMMRIGGNIRAELGRVIIYTRA